jgi:hypothetical protein
MEDCIGCITILVQYEERDETQPISRELWNCYERILQIVGGKEDECENDGYVFEYLGQAIQCISNFIAKDS